MLTKVIHSSQFSMQLGLLVISPYLSMCHSNLNLVKIITAQRIFLSSTAAVYICHFARLQIFFHHLQLHQQIISFTSSHDANTKVKAGLSSQYCKSTMNILATHRVQETSHTTSRFIALYLHYLLVHVKKLQTSISHLFHHC